MYRKEQPAPRILSENDLKLVQGGLPPIYITAASSPGEDGLLSVREKPTYRP